MVFETKTFILLHKLTADAKEKYEKILEDEATRIIFKNRHPIRYFFKKYFQKEYK